MSTTTYKIEAGALAECPEWEPHRRGKNWAATILRRDPKSPGGYARDFWTKAKGDFFYLVPDGLTVGMVVEFAGDYTTTSGGKEPHRTYAQVIAVTDTEMTVQELSTDEMKAALKGERSADVALTESEQTLIEALRGLSPDRRVLVITKAYEGL